MINENSFISPADKQVFRAFVLPEPPELLRFILLITALNEYDPAVCVKVCADELCFSKSPETILSAAANQP